MSRLSFIIALFFTLGAIALPNPNPLSADPSGDKNIGNGQGEQFITGACLSDADCQSQCCAIFSGGGICSARAAANQQGKQGCGFNSSGATPPSSTTPATTPPAAETPVETPSAANGVDSSAPGSENVGTGNGQQFITGQCFSDADCASDCCASRQGSATGACSAIAVANENGKTGCGFVQG